jgi:hypothetical protein
MTTPHQSTALQEVGQLPEFQVVRLLEKARDSLRASASAEPAVATAFQVLDSVMVAKQHSSTAHAGALATKLRDVARSLVFITNDKVQEAMLAMMAAADMSDSPK